MMSNCTEAAASALVEVLDRHLPRKWKQTPERCSQILEVVVEFLRTDRSWPTADRQLYAAKRVAKAHGHTTSNTVRAHCSRDLYGTGTSRQIDRFREALEAIETDLRPMKEAP